MEEYNWIVLILKFLTVLFVIDVLWISLEIFFYGERQPREVDDVIAVLWALTIMYKI